MNVLILILIIILSSISVFESSALLVGMRNSAGPTSWMNLSNIAFCISDIICGLFLSLFYFLKDQKITLAFLIFLLLSNFYREIEFIVKRDNPFCFNSGLFIVNTIKVSISFVLIFYMLKNRQIL